MNRFYNTVGEGMVVVYTAILTTFALERVGYTITEWQWWLGMVLGAISFSVLLMWHDRVRK